MSPKRETGIFSFTLMNPKIISSFFMYTKNIVKNNQLFVYILFTGGLATLGRGLSSSASTPKISNTATNRNIRVSFFIFFLLLHVYQKTILFTGRIL